MHGGRTGSDTGLNLQWLERAFGLDQRIKTGLRQREEQCACLRLAGRTLTTFDRRSLARAADGEIIEPDKHGRK